MLLVNSRNRKGLHTRGSPNPRHHRCCASSTTQRFRSTIPLHCDMRTSCSWRFFLRKVISDSNNSGTTSNSVQANSLDLWLPKVYYAHCWFSACSVLLHRIGLEQFTHSPSRPKETVFLAIRRKMMPKRAVLTLVWSLFWPQTFSNWLKLCWKALREEHHNQPTFPWRIILKILVSFLVVCDGNRAQTYIFFTT
jgi:hypothetical protein